MNVENVRSEPTGRTGHSMATVNNLLILYGGYDFFNTTIYNELWIHNTIGDTWIRHQAPFDTENRSTFSAICAVGNLVYIFGGKNPSEPSQATNSILMFNINSDTWQTLSVHTNDYDQNGPPPMYDSYIFYHNKSLYIVGGFTDGKFLETMFKFCLKTSMWTLVPQNAPKLSSTTRIFPTMFKNKLYCFGGYLENQTDRFEHLNIFDFSTNTWTTSQTHSKDGRFPSDSNYESFAFSGKFGYLSCGDYLFGCHHCIWKIDLESLEWFKLDHSLRSGIFLYNMAVISDSILYAFGVDTNVPIRAYKLERLVVQPPPLYRSCLETIARSPDVKMLAESIPESIVDELNKNRTD